MIINKFKNCFRRTSSTATDESEVVEDGDAGGGQGSVVPHVGRRILVVSGLYDDDRTVGNLIQHDHLERYRQRFVGSPVAGQHRAEYGRAACCHHLLAVDGPHILENACHVFLVHRVDVLLKRVRNISIAILVIGILIKFIL